MKKSESEMEFGGPSGALIFMFILPFTALYLNLACTKESCSIFSLPELPSINEVLNITCMLIFLGWFLLQVVLHLLTPGKLHKGLKLNDGKVLNYKCNGFYCLSISVLLFFVGVLLGVPVSYVYKNYIALISSSTIFCLLLSVFLYFKSLNISSNELAVGAGSGSRVHDFFLGRELNPRFRDFDLKFFCELRPGLIGWVIIDLCFVVETWKYGGPTPAQILVTAFHIIYVADSLWHEEALLTSMDITHDGLGFMLVFGNLAWVPFLYSLQARFLLEHPEVQWSMPYLVLFFLLNGVGYVIFRLSNSQKNEFRKNPNHPRFKDIKTLQTASGKKLLISSWWGISRHPNYMGDLIMSLSWSFATGFQHIMPYFYPLYFLSLLIHRAKRDDKHCRQKYGADWDKYCKLVPYKIFPYIY